MKAAKFKKKNTCLYRRKNTKNIDPKHNLAKECKRESLAQKFQYDAC